MRGTTENVPSFWMLACTRSLMKRASRSSSYSPGQSVLSSEARPTLLAGSSLPPASSRNTALTDLRPRLLDLGDELRFLERHAGHVVVLARIVAHFAEIGFEQLRHQTLARAAAQARPWCRRRPWRRSGSPRSESPRRSALADAVAVADLRVVRQIGHLQQGHAGGRAEEQIRASRRHRGPGHEHLHERAGGFGLAQQNRAGDLVVADDQLLVDAARRLAIDDHFVVWLRRLGLAHRRQFHAHDLELGAELRTEIGRVADSMP